MEPSIDMETVRLLNEIQELRARDKDKHEILEAVFSDPRDDDPNRPETEEDGIRAETLRRLKVRHQYQAFLEQSKPQA